MRTFEQIWQEVRDCQTADASEDRNKALILYLRQYSKSPQMNYQTPEAQMGALFDELYDKIQRLSKENRQYKFISYTALNDLRRKEEELARLKENSDEVETFHWTHQIPAHRVHAEPWSPDNPLVHNDKGDFFLDRTRTTFDLYGSVQHAPEEIMLHPGDYIITHRDGTIEVMSEHLFLQQGYEPR